MAGDGLALTPRLGPALAAPPAVADRVRPPVLITWPTLWATSPSRPMLRLKLVAKAGPTGVAIAVLTESDKPSSSTPTATARLAVSGPLRVCVRANPTSPSYPAVAVAVPGLRPPPLALADVRASLARAETLPRRLTRHTRLVIAKNGNLMALSPSGLAAWQHAAT